MERECCLLILERTVGWRSCDRLQDQPHQHNCMNLFTGCFQLGDVDPLENSQTEACTVGFSTRNPLARLEHAAFLASNALRLDNGYG